MKGDRQHSIASLKTHVKNTEFQAFLQALAFNFPENISVIVHLTAIDDNDLWHQDGASKLVTASSRILINLKTSANGSKY